MPAPLKRVVGQDEGRASSHFFFYENSAKWVYIFKKRVILFLLILFRIANVYNRVLNIPSGCPMFLLSGLFLQQMVSDLRNGVGCWLATGACPVRDRR